MNTIIDMTHGNNGTILFETLRNNKPLTQAEANKEMLRGCELPPHDFTLPLPSEQVSGPF